MDPELRKWILPSFSTSTREDSIVASVLMMGMLQKYFTFSCGSTCGIPSVNLLGTVADWEDISLRAEKLETYGPEPKVWLGLLRPVLRRFVRSVQKPNSKQTLEFWQRVMHRQKLGSGFETLTGWFTAFCFWNKEGFCMYKDPVGAKRWNLDPRNDLKYEEGVEDEEVSVQGEREDTTRDENGLLMGWSDDRYGRTWLVMDGARYDTIDIKYIPPGFGSVPVKVLHYGECTMVAESLGIKGTSSGRPMADGEIGLDSMQR